MDSIAQKERQYQVSGIFITIQRFLLVDLHIQYYIKH